jgi:anhydro-N-acetylmuramic acid kinase
VAPDEVEAIGHHGQTIWHEPDPPESFTWQLGDPNSIAAITGIDTVADLRRLDMALGGQGAPLVPPFHAWLFASEAGPRVVLNIGGIANLTLLAPGRDVIGFDTGPGNTLLDLWVRERQGLPYDDGGRWAASGTLDPTLLAACLDEPYLARAAPKSTGRELFNRLWLEQRLAAAASTIPDVNVAATLLELTARTITDAIAGLELPDCELIVCGGGARNAMLMARLGELAGRAPITTAEFGLDPDHVEAAAMAWLARARVAGAAGNLPTVTAAREAAVLGALYCGARPTV